MYRMGFGKIATGTEVKSMVEIYRADLKCYTQEQAQSYGLSVETYPDEFEPNKLVRTNQIYIDIITGESWGTGFQLFNRRSGPTGSNQGVTMTFFNRTLDKECFKRTFQNSQQDNFVILPGTKLNFYVSNDYKNEFSYFTVGYYTGDGGYQPARVFDFLKINFDPYNNNPNLCWEFPEGTTLQMLTCPTISGVITGDQFTIEGAIEYNYNI